MRVLVASTALVASVCSSYECALDLSQKNEKREGVTEPMWHRWVEFFFGAEMQALCLYSRCRFCYDWDSNATAMAPTDTGLAKTTRMAPQARTCVSGPGSGNPLDKCQSIQFYPSELMHGIH